MICKQEISHVSASVSIRVIDPSRKMEADGGLRKIPRRQPMQIEASDHIGVVGLDGKPINRPGWLTNICIATSAIAYIVCTAVVCFIEFNVV